jgi:DNA-binding MarR family transcriptional regulator
MGQSSSRRGPEAERLRALIRALVRRFQLAERADISCCGVTVAQAATLEALADGGGLRLGELGSRLGITASTLSRNINRLEERGLVRRRPDVEDRRAAVVELTTDGRRAAAEIERQEAVFARDILDRLPAGASRATLDAVEQLLHAIRDATDSCCPGAFDHLMTGPEWTACCERNER